MYSTARAAARSSRLLVAALLVATGMSANAAPILFDTFTPTPSDDVTISSDGTTATMTESGSFFFVDLFNAALYASTSSAPDPTATGNILSFSFDFTSGSDTGCIADLLFGDCDLLQIGLYSSDDPFNPIQGLDLFASASGVFSVVLDPLQAGVDLALGITLWDYDFLAGSTATISNLDLSPADDGTGGPVVSVPEPGSLPLLLAGLLALGLARARIASAPGRVV